MAYYPIESGSSITALLLLYSLIVLRVHECILAITGEYLELTEQISTDFLS